MKIATKPLRPHFLGFVPSIHVGILHGDPARVQWGVCPIPEHTEVSSPCTAEFAFGVNRTSSIPVNAEKTGALPTAIEELSKTLPLWLRSIRRPALQQLDRAALGDGTQRFRQVLVCV